MFDVYAQFRENARIFTALNPETLVTWPDAVRQSLEANFEVRLCKAFTESPLSLFVSNLAVRFTRWQQNLWQRPARRIWMRRHYLPLKRHSPAHR
jgi:hypothetical protein